MMFFELHRKNKINLLAEFVTSELSDVNQITRGETARFEFNQVGGMDATISTDTTIEAGEKQTYGVLTIASGVTLTVNGELFAGEIINNGTLIDNGVVEIGGDLTADSLRDYADFAGGFATVETLSSETKYREQIPSGADVNSIVLGVEPSDNLQNKDIPGIWGLVTNVTDTRNRAISVNRVEVELLVLAEFSEYANHTELENSLSV